MASNAEQFSDAPAPLSGTSLDPYGQLLKMLLPRAHSIVVYDRLGVPVWASEDNDDIELQALQQHAQAAELAEPGALGAGFAEPLPGEQVAYVFLLRDGDGAMLGVVGMVSRESNRDPRPFTLVHGLLRPALQCLERELASQSSIGNLQRSLVVRDRDLELLLGAAQEESEGGNSTDDFAKLVQGCVDHLGCAVGALLIPDKNIAVCRTATDTPPRAGADVLTRTHRQVLGWAQLHRQTMTSNVPHDSGPFANIPYKILACPVMHGAQRVHGVLVLFKRLHSPDFDLRQVRIVELLGRRVAYILMNSYDPTTGLLTRPAFEKRANAVLTPQTLQKDNCVIYVDIDRLHVLNENLGMHVGDSVIVRVAESHPAEPLAAHARGPHFGRPLRHLRARDVDRRDPRHRREPAAIVRAARLPARAAAGRSDRQLRRGERRRGQPSAVARARVRRDRLQGRERPRPQPGRNVLRRRPEHRAPLHRPDAHRHGALGACWTSASGSRRRPIVPLNGAPATPKFELLLRMSDEQGDSVPPEKFLSAAERYQLAPAIDRWVVRRTIEMLAPACRAGCTRCRPVSR